MKITTSEASIGIAKEVPLVAGLTAKIPVSKLVQVNTVGGRDPRELYKQLVLSYISKKQIMAGENLSSNVENACLSKLLLAIYMIRSLTV